MTDRRQQPQSLVSKIVNLVVCILLVLMYYYPFGTVFKIGVSVFTCVYVYEGLIRQPLAIVPFAVGVLVALLSAGVACGEDAWTECYRPYGTPIMTLAWLTVSSMMATAFQAWFVRTARAAARSTVRGIKYIFITVPLRIVAQLIQGTVMIVWDKAVKPWVVMPVVNAIRRRRRAVNTNAMDGAEEEGEQVQVPATDVPVPRFSRTEFQQRRNSRTECSGTSDDDVGYASDVPRRVDVRGAPRPGSNAAASASYATDNSSSRHAYCAPPTAATAAAAGLLPTGRGAGVGAAPRMGSTTTTSRRTVDSATNFHPVQFQPATFHIGSTNSFTSMNSNSNYNGLGAPASSTSTPTFAAATAATTAATVASAAPTASALFLPEGGTQPEDFTGSRKRKARPMATTEDDDDSVVEDVDQDELSTTQEPPTKRRRISTSSAVPVSASSSSTSSLSDDEAAAAAAATAIATNSMAPAKLSIQDVRTRAKQSYEAQKQQEQILHDEPASSSSQPAPLKKAPAKKKKTGSAAAVSGTAKATPKKASQTSVKAPKPSTKKQAPAMMKQAPAAAASEVVDDDRKPAAQKKRTARSSSRRV